MPQERQNLRNDPLIAFCRALPGATEDVKWGDNLVFSVDRKMFAVFNLPDADPFSFKVDPFVFTGLVREDGIEPAPYLARHHWVLVRDRTVLPTETLEDFFAESHRMVAAKLPKKTRRALGLDDEAA